MKQKISITLLFALFLISGSLVAQKTAPDRLNAQADEEDFYTKYVILATDSDEFEYALEVAEKLNPKETGYRYEILISGVLANELYDDRKEYKKEVRRFAKLGAHLVLCEIALDRGEVKEKKIYRTIEIIPDTFPYLLDLKKDGFHVLSHKG